MMRITEIDDNVVYTELTLDADADELERSYERITRLMDDYEKVHVYESVSVSGTDFLSMHAKASGDLRRGQMVDLGRVVAVGGGRLMRLFMTLWKLPVWPLSPDEIRHVPPARAAEAERWVRRAEP